MLLFSRSVVSNSLPPRGLQPASLPCGSPTPRACSSSCPFSWWYHTTTSSSVVPFSACLQYFPASGSFPVSQFFASGGQCIGASASASVLSMNIQDWFSSGLTGWISLESKGLSRVFSNITVWNHQFFGTQPSLWSSSHIYTWLLENANLTILTFVGKIMSPLFNMLFRFFMAAITVHSDFEAWENKVNHCFPIHLPWSDGIGCHDLCFFNVEF